jgi:hypothetical protein
MKSNTYPEVESARVQTRKVTLAFRENRTEIEGRSDGTIGVTVEFDTKPFQGFSQDFHRLFAFEMAAQGFSVKEQDEIMGGLFENMDDVIIMKAIKASIVNRDAQ